MMATGPETPDAERLRLRCCRSCRCSTPIPGASRSPASIRGARMVMPGARLDGASVYDLLETEKVTMTAAVPTVWLGLLHYLRKEDKRLSTLKLVGHRRLGLPARHDPRLRGRLRRRGAPRLGHDRNEPGRLGRLDQAEPDGALARGEARASKQAGLGAVRRRDEDRRRREQRRCRGTASASAGSRSRASPSSRAISRTRAARSSTRTASSTPATSPPSTPTASCRSPIAPRT